MLAIVDEVQEAAGDNPYRHTNKLKSLVNAEFRDLNPKFGRQYREHNACRWLVFSNHDNALPMNDTDRGWRVVRHTAPEEVPCHSRAALRRVGSFGQSGGDNRELRKAGCRSYRDAKGGSGEQKISSTAEPAAPA